MAKQSATIIALQHALNLLKSGQTGNAAKALERIIIDLEAA